ncbi:hypothetical protein [Actinokineospora enzanensis]|uniref:hypothetical protein n=1 Tax=Actinokineospora enzanensis TaxID=155975 RepID=UPI0003804ADC|nr:hypothetical protein [Actinokineospora enzanensis]
MTSVFLRIGAAICLAATSFIHADLYIHGYRVLAVIGPSFLLQASGALALAILLPFTSLLMLRLLAAGVAVTTLAGFLMSRTVGLFGFMEAGLEPAPQALLSIVAEFGILVLLAADVLYRRRSRQPVADAALQGAHR